MDKSRFFPQVASLLVVITIVLLLYCSGRQDSFTSDHTTLSTDEILARLDVPRGICAVVGDTLARRSIDLARHSELVVYLQIESEDAVNAARRSVDSAGFYGTRIYVERGEPGRIHLADNMADLFINFDNSAVPQKEVLRILRPDGIGLTGDREIRKPFPDGADDWSHPYHGPDNNTQSKDRIIKAPYLTQFFAEPYYAPVTQLTVASAGKVFKGFGNVAFHEREEDFLNKLVAFNGYNGTVLWQRDLTPGLMLHRNIAIATPEILYWGDDKSCKMISTATGELLDEIAPPIKIAGGTFWKWMGMEKGVLYALVGAQEEKDPVMRWRRQQHGWPWTEISEGFNKQEHTWGFGNTVMAIDPKSKKIKWHHTEELPMDSRALVLKNGRLYLFRFGEYLRCLDAGNGKVIWSRTREDSPELFEAMGKYLERQGYSTNWRTRNYVLAGEEALYFAGPQIDKLLAVSVRDGSVLWQNEYDNFQLVLREDGLYGISGPWRNNVSKKFDPVTGDILAELPTGRRACTRPNGAADAIFFRASGGTVRLDLGDNTPKWISPMRPSCQDGVTIANGYLYWWPYVCDCQLSIYGVAALGPAGDFEFARKAVEEERLEQKQNEVAAVMETSADWPSFRKDNQGRLTTTAMVARTGKPRWRYPARPIYNPGTNVLGHPHYKIPTAPVTCDGLAFWGDSDGIVRAVNVLTGELLWKAYTGGPIRIAPTIWEGRVFVGSGDGYVYSLSARTGELLWRFRAAPVERKIPVYGSLMSTWPAASGVVVQDGVAYVAAGIVNYDGIHVYALDAKSGRIIWQNNNSGHLLPEAQTGASVMGHLIIKDGKLYLASGTSLSPAVYDISDGKCLNDPEPLKYNESYAPRGWELYLIGDHVVASGKPFYSHPRHQVYDATVTNKLLHCTTGQRDVLWVNQKKLVCTPSVPKSTLNASVAAQGFAGYKAPVWGKLDLPFKPYWEYACNNSRAVAVTKNAVVLAEETELIVLDLASGKILWTAPLEYPPVQHGIAVCRDGTILLTLEDNSIRSFGGRSTLPVPYVSSQNTFFVESTRLKLDCNVKGASIYYTMDGTEPTESSTLYTHPIEVRESCTLKMRAYAEGLPPGFVVVEDVKRIEYDRPIDKDDIAPGLTFEYFEALFQSVHDMDGLEPTSTGVIDAFRVKPAPGADEYGYIYRGYLIVPSDGIYTFFLNSNDGSKLYINGQELIDNDGGHTAIEKSAEISLKAGEYPIEVRYFQMGGAQAFDVLWRGPGIRKQPLDAKVLFHKKESTDAV